MNKIEEKEISELVEYKAAGKEELEKGMTEFAQELNNGLGEAMIEELRNPSSRKVKSGFFYRFKMWIRKLSENFKFIFYA